MLAELPFVTTLNNALIKANLLMLKAMIVARFGAIQFIEVCDELHELR